MHRLSNWHKNKNRDTIECLRDVINLCKTSMENLPAQAVIKEKYIPWFHETNQTSQKWPRIWCT